VKIWDAISGTEAGHTQKYLSSYTLGLRVLAFRNTSFDNVSTLLLEQRDAQNKNYATATLPDGTPKKKAESEQSAPSSS